LIKKIKNYFINNTIRWKWNFFHFSGNSSYEFLRKPLKNRKLNKNIIINLDLQLLPQTFIKIILNKSSLKISLKFLMMIILIMPNDLISQVLRNLMFSQILMNIPGIIHIIIILLIHFPHDCTADIHIISKSVCQYNTTYNQNTLFSPQRNV
jgi:hypothetical protein